MITEEAITNDNERERDSGNQGKNSRTCVGCGAKDAPSALVRLVFADPEVVVDASGKASRDFGGRGAHVHPRKVCVQMACKNGLSRAFKATVKANADDLAKEIASAFDRRIEGLITSARGAQALVVGSDKGLTALRNGAPLAIIACDAGSIAQKDEVLAAISEGRAIAWRDKNGLGAIVDRQDVAMFVVENSGIARAIREAAGAVASLGADETRNGSEVR